MFSPQEKSRRAELKSALKKEVIGQLPDSVSHHLTPLLNVYKNCLDIRETFCLNCAINDTFKLRVYTCNREQKELTVCTEGNTLYDQELDVIFIDQSLILPDAWNEKGTRKIYISFLKHFWITVCRVI